MFTLFIDIDGTLITPSSTQTQQNRYAIQRLALHFPLYFATSLPVNHAEHKTRDIWHYFQGGSFANGADLHYAKNTQRIITPLPEQVLRPLSAFQQRQYRHQGTLYKVTVRAYHALPLSNRDYHIVQEGHVWSITAKQTSKCQGIITLLPLINTQKQNVIVIGNDHNDQDMLRYFSHSIAVPNSPIDVQQHAKSVMTLPELTNYLLTMQQCEESETSK